MKTRMVVKALVEEGEIVRDVVEKAEPPAVFLSRSWVRSEIHTALVEGCKVELTAS